MAVCRLQNGRICKRFDDRRMTLSPSVVLGLATTAGVCGQTDADRFVSSTRIAEPNFAALLPIRTVNEEDFHPDSAVQEHQLCGDRFRCWVGFFGTDDPTADSPGRIIKVDIKNGPAQPRIVGALTLDAGETGLSCAVIDPAAGYAYFGTGRTFPGIVVKVALGSGDLLRPAWSLTLEDSPLGYGYLGCAVINTVSWLCILWNYKYANGADERD